MLVASRSGELGDAAPLSSAGAAAFQVPPLARMVVPGLVVGLVERKKHPFIWWAFGVIPLGLAGAAFVAQVSKKPT